MSPKVGSEDTWQAAPTSVALATRRQAKRQLVDWIRAD